MNNTTTSPTAPTWYGPGEQSPVLYRGGDSDRDDDDGHTVWVGVQVGHVVTTGIRLDIDQNGMAEPGVIVLDAVNTRKLAAQLVNAADILERALEPDGAR